MKATAIAPSNIAFIKYWGKKNEDLHIPENGSISMNLSNLLTTTTVEFSEKHKEDIIIINEKDESRTEIRIINYLNLIRKKAKINLNAKVVSKNNFPIGTGLSSSASGFAALTLASSKAAGLNLSEKDLSILARLGSGSACRSIPNGFVEWIEGEDSESSFAESIYPSNYWNILDIVAIVSNEKKDISSNQGQKSFSTSSFFKERKKHINEKIKNIKTYLKNKNFIKFGELVEEETLELHSIMLTSKPSLIYLTPESLFLIKLIKNWRENKNLPIYFTINTGQDVHIICEEKNKEKLIKLLKEVNFIKEIIVNRSSDGARIINSHLF